MFVKPAPRPDDPDRLLVVRLCHARNRFLSPLGEEVPDTLDWHRALARGDVVLAERPAVSGEVQLDARPDDAHPGIQVEAVGSEGPAR